jgi:hypothetical protein
MGLLLIDDLDQDPKLQIDWFVVDDQFSATFFLDQLNA